MVGYMSADTGPYQGRERPCKELSSRPPLGKDTDKTFIQQNLSLLLYVEIQ
jgi:hypothetical protein